MATRNHELNFEANEAMPTSTELSQRSQLLKTCRNLFGAKDLEPEESKFWAKFLGEFSLADLRYAFENWNRNGHWFPKPSDIKELCHAYQLSEAQKVKPLPVGCSRCEWTGWYTVTWRSSVERAVAPCPCCNDSKLRERCDKNLVTNEEFATLRAQIMKLAGQTDMNKIKAGAISEKQKRSSGVVPSSLELAEQLQKQSKNWKAE